MDHRHRGDSDAMLFLHWYYRLLFTFGGPILNVLGILQSWLPRLSI